MNDKDVENVYYDYDLIENRAHELYRESERRRGGIRGAMSIWDTLDAFIMLATMEYARGELKGVDEQ